MGTRLVLVALIGLTAWLYVPVLSGPFVYDDLNVLDLRTTPTWRVPGRALTMWTYRVTAQRGGSIREYHAVNIALHLVNGALVAAVAAPVVGPVAGVLAAGMFLLHPLNSEAVSYIAARTDLLMTAGVLVALWAAVAWRARWRWIGIIAGLLVAALSKEMGVIGVAVLVLTLWLLDDRRSAGWLLGVATAAGIGEMVVLGAPAWFEIPVMVGGAMVSWDVFLPVQLAQVWTLLSLVIWPVGLTIDHDPIVIPVFWQAVALGLTVQTVGVMVWAWRRAPLLAWAIGWVALSVSLRFVFRTSEFVTEPQFYLAMVGISVVGGRLLAALVPDTISYRKVCA